MLYFIICFIQIDFQGRELYLGMYVKNTLNAWLSLNVYELISFEHGMMLDMTTLYSLILVD